MSKNTTTKRELAQLSSSSSSEQEENKKRRLSLQDNKTEEKESSSQKTIEFSVPSFNPNKTRGVEYWSSLTAYVKALGLDYSKMKQFSLSEWENVLKAWDSFETPYLDKAPIRSTITGIIALLSPRSDAQKRDLASSIQQIQSLIKSVSEIQCEQLETVQQIIENIKNQGLDVTKLMESFEAMKYIATNSQPQIFDLSTEEGKVWRKNYNLQGMLSVRFKVALMDLEIKANDLDTTTKTERLVHDLERALISEERRLWYLGGETFMVGIMLLSMTGFSPFSHSISTDAHSARSMKRLDDDPSFMRYNFLFPSDLLKDPGTLSWSYKDKESPEALVQMNSAYQDFINNATFLKRIKGNYDERNYRHCMIKVVDSLDKALDSESVSGNRRSTKMFPGPTSQEVHGAQVVFGLLLDKLSEMIVQQDDTNNKLNHDNNCSVYTGSPSRQKRSKKNPLVRATTKRPKRVDDFPIWNHGPHVEMLRKDDGMEFVFEIMPGQQVDLDAEGVRQESRDQLLSHLAKALIVALNFQGIGIDSHATGVIMSLAYVEILQLKLENTERKAKLTFLSTGPLPLMTETNFDKWYKSDKRHKEDNLIKLKKQLYGDSNNKKGFCNKGVPLGLYALWDIMQKPRHELMGPDFKPYFLSGQIGALIGTGTFSHIFVDASNTSRVIKVSRYGRKRSIENEKDVLTQLGCESGGSGCHENLPRFEGDLEMNFVRGGVTFKSPGIILSPRGLPVKYWVSTMMKDDAEVAKTITVIGEKLMLALKYIHEKGWVHNDITYNNIVILQNGTPVLIDFGEACKLGEVIHGFRGTYAFAHKEVHTREEHEAQAKYDEVGLMYTLAILTNGCLIPPDTFPERVIREEYYYIFSKRSQWTEKKLESLKGQLKYKSDKRLIQKWLSIAIGETPSSSRGDRSTQTPTRSRKARVVKKQKQKSLFDYFKFRIVGNRET